MTTREQELSSAVIRAGRLIKEGRTAEAYTVLCKANGGSVMESHRPVLHPRDRAMERMRQL